MMFKWYPNDSQMIPKLPPSLPQLIPKLGSRIGLQKVLSWEWPPIGGYTRVMHIGECHFPPLENAFFNFFFSISGCLRYLPKCSTHQYACRWKLAGWYLFISSAQRHLGALDSLLWGSWSCGQQNMFVDTGPGLRFLERYRNQILCFAMMHFEEIQNLSQV